MQFLAYQYNHGNEVCQKTEQYSITFIFKFSNFKYLDVQFVLIKKEDFVKI